jgi:hypothetical protein
MTTEFEQDLTRVQSSMGAARQDLLATLARLNDADLQRGTRGGWPVRKVIEHTLQSEWIYVALIHHLRGRTSDIPEAKGVQVATLADGLMGLKRARATLLDVIDGVDEETFYQLQRAGHEEYSVLSVLENVELHDQEHAAQIERIMAASTEAKP